MTKTIWVEFLKSYYCDFVGDRKALHADCAKALAKEGIVKLDFCIPEPSQFVEFLQPYGINKRGKKRLIDSELAMILIEKGIAAWSSEPDTSVEMCATWQHLEAGQGAYFSRSVAEILINEGLARHHWKLGRFIEKCPEDKLDYYELFNRLKSQKSPPLALRELFIDNKDGMALLENGLIIESTPVSFPDYCNVPQPDVVVRFCKRWPGENEHYCFESDDPVDYFDPSKRYNFPLHRAKHLEKMGILCIDPSTLEEAESMLRGDFDSSKGKLNSSMLGESAPVLPQSSIKHHIHSSKGDKLDTWVTYCKDFETNKVGGREQVSYDDATLLEKQDIAKADFHVPAETHVWVTFIQNWKEKYPGDREQLPIDLANFLNQIGTAQADPDFYKEVTMVRDWHSYRAGQVVQILSRIAVVLEENNIVEDAIMVKFLKTCRVGAPGYNTGESASFPANVARALVEQGFAVFDWRFKKRTIVPKAEEVKPIQPQPEPVKPIQRHRAQEMTILDAFRNSHINPKELVKHSAGKKDIKHAIWIGLEKRTDLFGSRLVFDKAWQRLRNYREIQEKK